MSLYVNSMNQDAVYYPPTGQDLYGTDTYGTAQPLKVRWQQKAVMIRNYEGREVVSDSIVYCSLEVEARGKLGLGSDATFEESKIIQSVQSSPTLNGNETLIKAML